MIILRVKVIFGLFNMVCPCIFHIALTFLIIECVKPLFHEIEIFLSGFILEAFIAIERPRLPFFSVIRFT